MIECAVVQGGCIVFLQFASSLLEFFLEIGQLISIVARDYALGWMGQ